MGVVVFIPGQRSVKLVRSAALLLGTTGLPLGWFITRRWRRLQEVETILRSAIRDNDTQQNVSLFPCLHNVLSMHYTQNIRLRRRTELHDFVSFFPVFLFSFITCQIMWLISQHVCTAHLYCLSSPHFTNLPMKIPNHIYISTPALFVDC